ncbi:response regulator [Sphingobacterium sp. ML3W]|uniref:response regulator n=1 Tax=Sphingobacterium sp. ML3W TaxID=1538644 RepID=UPI00249B0F7E|nr:response regulator [Sphingobacterium sp. ML3W]WFA80790.1 response regulator [Sphingobacterium sp. ML3W]
MSKKIIICDDEALILDVLALALTNDKTDVIATTKNMEIMPLIDAVRPDLLLTDLQMPKVSGDTIVREIRNSEKFSQLPVIIMSASSLGEQAARDCGADGFLAKPFDLDDLYFLVDKLLRA